MSYQEVRIKATGRRGKILTRYVDNEFAPVFIYGDEANYFLHKDQYEIIRNNKTIKAKAIGLGIRLSISKKHEIP